MLRLCSASPSRALLLEKFSVEFSQVSVDYDEEKIEANAAKNFVYMASKGKLEAAIRKFGLDIPLLCADTVIASANGSILRKPKNLEDAKRILKLQSGSHISIISSLHYQSKTRAFSNISSTHYHFEVFEEAQLEAYLKSNLWQGKAGGCMVEGFCKQYIKSVDGYESTAMGLQVECLLSWI